MCAALPCAQTRRPGCFITVHLCTAQCAINELSCYYCNMRSTTFPSRQGQLIRFARGEATQAEFARRLGVHRSCLSRYESEALGAPTAVLNICLQALAEHLNGKSEPATTLERALMRARQTVEELEVATKARQKASRR